MRSAKQKYQCRCYILFLNEEVSERTGTPRNPVHNKNNYIYNNDQNSSAVSV